MNREDIFVKLREHAVTVHTCGVSPVALFGSRARGEQRPESDTDIMIELDPAVQITIFDYLD